MPAPANYARSRRNATTHGLSARHVTLTHRERARLQRQLRALVREYQPANPEELALLRDLARAVIIDERVWTCEMTLLAQDPKAAVTFSLRHARPSERRCVDALHAIQTLETRRLARGAQNGSTPKQTTNPFQKKT